MNRQDIVHLRDDRGDCLIGPAAAFDRRFRLAMSQDPARLGARLDHFHGHSESMAKLRRLHVALYGGGRTVQASDAEVLAALRRGLTTRRLVMVCGQPVAPLSVRRGQSLADSLAVFSQLAATVTTTTGSVAGPAIGAPAPTPSIPVAGWTLEQRIEQVLRLTQDKLPRAMRAEFAELISPQAIAITVGIIVVWAASHGTPVGPAVDIILLLVGIVALGWGIFEAASALYDFIAAILGAKTERDLDRAAEHLARAISLLGVAAFAALLRKIGRIGRPRDGGRPTTPATHGPEPPPPPPIEIGRVAQPGRRSQPDAREQTPASPGGGQSATPLGFANAGQFQGALAQIRGAAGVDDAIIGVRGSAASGARHSGGSFGPGSDIDFFIVSEKLYRDGLALGARQSNGALRVSATMRHFPELHRVEQALSAEVGRKVTVRIFSPSGYDALRSATDIIGN